MIWSREDGTIERFRLSEPAETITEGTPLLGGEGWFGTIACPVELEPGGCEIRFIDLVTDIEWRLEIDDTWTTSIIRSTAGRRAVLSLGRSVDDDRVFLVDADELVTRPIDLSSTHGAAFDPTDRFVLHASWGIEESLLCALDLETGRRSCLDPGVDFSGVLVRPPR